MAQKKDGEKKLRDLFEHHASHEIEGANATPFIDIHVDGEVALQFSYGALNLAATDNSQKAQDSVLHKAA
jgi:hypothetical protein